ncbi:MAG: hypothetical protein E7360_03345 [Clostridiales bacterium]|nr:hypothetical protein [Clostridiales bacterium]
MKRKIFIRFFALTCISVLLVFAVGLLAVNLSAKNLIRERLEAETKLACALVKEKSDLDTFQVYFNNDEFRVTVFDLEGNVIKESDTKADLEPHADREEFILALQGKSEAIERFSKTFNCRMTYYALKTSLSNGEEIVIRLAIKNSQVLEYISLALPLLLVVLAVALITSIIFANLQSKLIAKQINEVGKSLKSINEGKFVPIKVDSSDDELFAVYSEINDLASTTYDHVSKEEREHKKLDSVLSSVAQGIIALNKENKIVFANKSAYTLFSRNGVEGKDLVFLIDDLNLYNNIIESRGKNYSFEYGYDQKILLFTITEITDENLATDLSSIIIITDVTAERTIAKQKSDFFANASHELKTPVTVMQGLSEILLSKDLGEQSKKQVERIYKESVRLASLISDMLKLSKLERGEEDFSTLTEVDLTAVTEEVFSELSQKAEEKGVELKLFGQGKIYADYKKIYELIENLVSNAVNYNKQNGKVTVEITNEEDSTEIKVTDTGIGIEKEHIPRLCERFYRVDKSHSKKTGGTGLGLAIVKHICALYGASLSIESELGVGTTVIITLKSCKGIA